MLEDAINAEKKRHHEVLLISINIILTSFYKEIQRLQASIVDNERLASVQENVNLLQVNIIWKSSFTLILGRS